MSSWTPVERRLLDLAVHPEHFGLAAPRGDPPVTPAGEALVAAHRAWQPRVEMGIRVDLTALAEARADVARAVREGTRRLGPGRGKDTPQTREWLWRHLGVLLPRNPDTGLATLAHESWPDAVVPAESAEEWAAWCELRTATASAGILASIAASLGDDAMVHPVIDVFGARTGRMSIRHPAMQATTRRLRHLFMARPGMVLVGADVCAMEPSVAAWLSADEVLTADLASGDAYLALARSVYGHEAGPVERERAKIALLATLYGQGTASLAQRLGIAQPAAKELLGGLEGRYRRLFRWFRELERDCDHLVTPWGRPLPVPPPDPGTGRPRHYLARNWVVQGSAADLFRRCVQRVADHDAAACWLPIHDELVLEVAEARAERAAGYLTEAMGPRLGDVQLRADARVLGTHWSK